MAASQGWFHPWAQASEKRSETDEVAWAVRLRKLLEGHGGEMPLHQQTNNDPKGKPSLIL